jgi:hypothetical protein
VQLGVTLGGLTECKAFPRAEVRLDQVVVNGDVEPKRLGSHRGGVVGALQGRRDDRRNTAALRSKAVSKT